MIRLATDPAQETVSTQSRRQISHQGTLQRLVRGKNISEKTLLATDYLNHFNEIIMMLELVPVMPDCFDDAKSWQPMSYSEHFRASCFTDKDLAVLAYENAPDCHRIPFDQTIDDMNRRIIEGLGDVEGLIESGGGPELELAVSELCGGLRGLVDQASAIIHGHHDATAAGELGQAELGQAELGQAGFGQAASEPTQADLDATDMDGQGAESEVPTDRSDQAAIDALFDD